jgi:hypothetical protein
VPKLHEQLLTLVLRGSKIDHQAGDHDDWANAAAGAVEAAVGAVFRLSGVAAPLLVEVNEDRPPAELVHWKDFRS